MAYRFDPEEDYEFVQLGYQRVYFKPYGGTLQCHTCNHYEHWIEYHDLELDVRVGDGGECDKINCPVFLMRPDVQLPCTIDALLAQSMYEVIHQEHSDNRIDFILQRPTGDITWTETCDGTLHTHLQPGNTFSVYCCDWFCRVLQARNAY